MSAERRPPLELTFARADAGDEPAAGLIAAMRAELVTFYGPRVADGTPTATPEELSPPGGVCLLGCDPVGMPVCVGGVKELKGVELTGEIKRMYVVPAARGAGVARQLLTALEDAARELGYARVRLDTGPKQPHAKSLYISAGYREIENYNANAYAAFWGEREL